MTKPKEARLAIRRDIKRRKHSHHREETTMTMLTEIRNYMTQRDRIANAWKLQNSPLALPGQTSPPSVGEFANVMDTATRRVMHELSGEETWTPLEWEAFLELIPNIRKLLNMTGEGGF